MIGTRLAYIGVALLLIFCVLRQYPASSAEMAKPDAKAGEQKFQLHCAACHNHLGKVGPPMIESTAYFVEAGIPGVAMGSLLQKPVRQRPPGSIMPAFSPEEISDQDLNDIGYYLASFTQPPSIPPALGSAELGAVLYKNNCALCHGTQGEGNGKAIPLAFFSSELKQGGAPPNVILGFVNLAARSGFVKDHPVFSAERLSDGDLANIAAAIWSLPVPEKSAR